MFPYPLQMCVHFHFNMESLIQCFRKPPPVWYCPWLESVTIWKLAKTDFYKQYEFSIDDINLPESVRFLTDPHFTEELRNTMQALFDTTLSKDVRSIAHKLMPDPTYWYT